MRSSLRPAPAVGARALVVWFTALCALVGSAGAAQAEVIERILAIVDGRPLMLSEVALLERVRGVPRARALEALIDEALMFREASRLPTTRATADDEERAYASLRERLGPDAAGRLEGGLRRLARRETAILKYVVFRFGPQVRIADQAPRATYDAEVGGRPGAPAFEAVEAELRERLYRQALDEAVEAWVRELRAGAEIRRNPDPEALSPSRP